MLYFNQAPVEKLEEVKKEDIDAIQTLYYLFGADRTNANAMIARYRAQNYRTQILESQVVAAWHQEVVTSHKRRYILTVG